MYPALAIDIKKVKDNIKIIYGLCNENNIKITGVIKGCDGISEVAQAMIESGIYSLGSSRVEQLSKVKSINSDAETLLLRIPMMSELNKVVDSCDISLQSEIKVLKKLNDICINKNKVHKVILMMDLGDLREGFIDKDEFINVARKVENEFEGIILGGIGTNLGCYGSVKATDTNLGRLSDIASEIEALIGRKLEYVSGGASSSLPLLLEGNMPKGINHLRLGESILTSRELDEFYGYKLDGITKDAFTLEAEIVEIKEKPTHPVGELSFDAFGNKPTYEDRGIKTRIILAVGRQDFGCHDKLLPIDSDVEIIGSSSDHLIVESDAEYSIGDILCFELYYPAMLYLSESSYVKKIFI